MAMPACREHLCAWRRGLVGPRSGVGSSVGYPWLCDWGVPSGGGEADDEANGLCIGDTRFGPTRTKRNTYG
jgi:hypothetical protein